MEFVFTDEASFTFVLCQ